MSPGLRNAAINTAVWLLLVAGAAFAALILVANLILFSMIIGASLGSAVGILAAVHFSGSEGDDPFDFEDYGFAH